MSASVPVSVFHHFSPFFFILQFCVFPLQADHAISQPQGKLFKQESDGFFACAAGVTRKTALLPVYGQIFSGSLSALTIAQRHTYFRSEKEIYTAFNHDDI